MQKINLKLYEFDRLKRFRPQTRTFSTESILYLYPQNNKKRILKLFYNMDYNKILTINLINYYKNDIDIKELALDCDLVSIENKPAGIVSDYIDGTILSNIIYDKGISLNYKIDVLKKVGVVLDKMKKTRDIINEFYIGDLHEDNIIVTNNDIKIMDMDSSKIMDNKPFPSKYLTRLAKRKKIDSLIIPNEYTDNYCFNMMILNAIFSKDISKLSIDEFYRCIEYLYSIGIDINLINNFNNMYLGNTLNLHNQLDSLKKLEKVYLK